MAKLTVLPSRYLLKPQSLLDRLGGNLLAPSATSLSLFLVSVCLSVLCLFVCVAGGGRVVEYMCGRGLSINYLRIGHF